MKKRVLATVMAAIFTLLSMGSMLPAFAETTRYQTPSGYNDYEYQKIIQFLEITDAYGVKNGTKIRSDYDPLNPETWSNYLGEGIGFYGEYGSIYNGVCWDNFDGESTKRIKFIDLSNMGVVGQLDVSNMTRITTVYISGNSMPLPIADNCPSLDGLVCHYCGFSEIDLSGFPNLVYLYCTNNELAGIDLSCCPNLEVVQLHSNALTDIDLSCCPNLKEFNCTNNCLTTLDVSCCPELKVLYCNGNNLTEIDTSACPQLEELYCGRNPISYLDLYYNRNLINLYCNATDIIMLDLYWCPHLQSFFAANTRLTNVYFYKNDYIRFDEIRSQGNGDFSVVLNDISTGESYVTGTYERSMCHGWFNENGYRYTANNRLNVEYIQCSVLTARFDPSEFIMGDTDNNGVVTANDALLTLRYTLDLVNDMPVLGAADIDGSGTIMANEALTILRAALGLTTL